VRTRRRGFLRFAGTTPHCQQQREHDHHEAGVDPEEHPVLGVYVGTRCSLVRLARRERWKRTRRTVVAGQRRITVHGLRGLLSSRDTRRHGIGHRLQGPPEDGDEPRAQQSDRDDAATGEPLARFHAPTLLTPPEVLRAAASESLAQLLEARLWCTPNGRELRTIGCDDVA